MKFEEHRLKTKGNLINKMAFVDAMSHESIWKKGVKGSDVYTEAGVGDLPVVLFTQLVRGASPSEIKRIIGEIMTAGHVSQIMDVIVMAFQTRDIRGGKGERDLFFTMLGKICEMLPELSLALVKLVPTYGCWKDLWKLRASSPQMSKAIDELVHEQFRNDQESESPSLLAKWLPREKTKPKNRDNYLAIHFANLFFPLTPSAKGQRMRVYRRCLATLNRAIDTTEIKMCSKDGLWSQIQPSNVPGRLMKRCKKAFFNQTNIPKRAHCLSSNIRYPDRQDRLLCAENFKEFLVKVGNGEEKMKGGDTTMPHEHIHELLNNSSLSEESLAVIQAQWDAIRTETLKRGGLGKIVAMCDFSGSMEGQPKEVSLALGILISEVASPSFQDHILTFDSEPTWHSFAGLKTLKEKVDSIGGKGHGLSTNFQGAADLILARLIQYNVSVEDAPTDLLVLTDMGFDEASDSEGSIWETHFQKIRKSFQDSGYEPPRIVCWNISAKYADFHAQAHEIGVVQLSGWSPAVLKALQGDGIRVETAYDGMRKLLDAPRYEPVRKALARA